MNHNISDDDDTGVGEGGIIGEGTHNCWHLTTYGTNSPSQPRSFNIRWKEKMTYSSCHDDI